jgi:hypothetical protein
MKENKEHSIRISNALIQSEYPTLPTVDSYRILQLCMSKICENLYHDKEASMTVSLKIETLKKLFLSFAKAGNIHKRIDDATSIILKNNIIQVLRKDQGNFKKTAFVESIEYKNSNEIVIKFIEETRALFNPNSDFTRYVISNTAKLSTYQQIRIYELCYQYIASKHKYRIIDIVDFKRFVGIKKNKTTSKLMDL